ncbi:MAG: bile acid:sodium symporter family protein [Pseudomonadota bacterium]
MTYFHLVNRLFPLWALLLSGVAFWRPEVFSGGAPVVLGVMVHHFLAGRIRTVEPVLASVAMVVICVIIAIVVAMNAGQLATLAPLVAAAVMVHNALGLTGGYWLSRLFRLDEATARTVAIEVGMQNSGLAVALANQFFTTSAALPGALFSVWHNLSGSALAAWWQRRRPDML